MRGQVRAAREAGEAKARRVVGTNAVGVAFSNGSGAIVEANDAFLKMVGATRAELQRGEVRWSAITPLEYAPLDELARAQLERTGLQTPYEKEYVKKDGTRVPVLVATTDLDPPNQANISFVLDQTQHKKIEHERDVIFERERAARAEAEAASRMKDEFLAMVSHELRTPLNAILGWSQLLRSGTFAPEQAEHGLDTIERNAKAQAQLIDDLLDVSRITSGKLRLDVQRIDPLLPLESALETVRAAAEAKEIEIVRKVGDDVGLVLADIGRLQQIIWNLLSNAIKFTPRKGRVEIAVDRRAGQVELIISDTGIGIRSEFLPHVFDRFRQADTSSTRGFGGLGLGLAIVRHLVELHGGTVRAESGGEGKGSKLSVTLPAVERTLEIPPVMRPYRGALGGGVLAGLRVLVVDDDADARELLKLTLEESRAVVETAGSADEAMAILARLKPQVMISDIGMPKEDGYSLIRRVRALPPDQGGSTPAIALTAFVRSEDRERALEAGFQVHVAKPVQPTELTSVVAQLARVPVPADEPRSPSVLPGSPAS